MRLKAFFGASAVGITLALAGAGSASAATEFGDSCGGTTAAGEYTLMTLDAPPATLPLAAPSGGVITKVKVNSAIGVTVSIPTAVKVLRSAGGNKYTVIGQQSVLANPGVTTADARIPVQQGDRLGLRGEPFVFEGSTISASLYCAGAPGTLGAVLGDVPVGSTAEFLAVTTARVPLAAVIEPDADGDGYGDETQDGCPQVASLQTPCPVVTVEASSIIKRKGSVVVLVTTSSSAPVKVTGTVKLGKGQKAKLSGPTKTVALGKVTRFTLKFPKKLKDKLGDLTKKQSLQLKINARATDLVGRVTKDSLKTRLKGQANN